jgi:predicted Zn-dependent protease
MPIANSNKDQLKTTLDRSIKLIGRGKHREALRILNPLSRQHMRSAAVFGTLGRAFFEIGDMEKAGNAFRRAVDLNPKSELASLGLFHSLWGQEAASEAFAEMRRFLSMTDSTEYKTLLRDLAVEGHLAPRLHAAGAA